MATLSSSIVKNHVASMREVEEALARQVIYGGDLVTNLLELAPVSEPELTQLLAESHSLEPAPRGELPRASDAVLRLVPSELALRHGFYPLEERDGTLAIAVSDPLPAEVEGDLGFSLGVSIVQTAAPLVRIRQAIARDYDLPLDRRMLRLVAKLEGRPDPSPSSMPAPLRENAVGFPKLPRPASVPPIGYPTPTTLISHATPPPEAPEVERAPPPSSLPAIPPPAADRDASPTVSTLITPRHPSERAEPASNKPPRWLERAIPRERGRKRHRGPFTAAMAEHDLFEAESRDDVIGAFFDFASQYFEYSALFALQGDIAEGRDAHGPGADPVRIRGIGIPLDLPSALASAKNAKTFRLLTLGNDGLDVGLAKDLEREPGRVVLILPIIVRGRCVLLLYGDHGRSDVVLDEVGDVIAFSPLVTAALERVIMKKKISARREVASEVGTAMPMPLSEIQKRHRHRLPGIEQRVEALARALDATGTSSAESRVPSTGEESPQAKAAPMSAAPATAAASPAALGPPATQSASPQAKMRAQPVVAVGPSETPAEDHPFPLTRRTPSGRVVPIVAPPPSSDNPEAVDAGWDAQPEASGAATTKPEGQKRRTTQPFEREAELRSDVGHEAPLAPVSRQLAVGPSPPFRRQDAKDRLLPSVIVDVDADCKSLVLRLLEGDQWAADRLVQIGDPAVSVLVAQFPGPIHPDRYRRFADPGARASECGPVLSTVARMGMVAVPFLVVRTADRDAVVRRWATWLLGELPNADSARAVVRRFSDSDADVRRAALAAGRMMQADVESRTALRDGLATLAAEPSQLLEVRHASIEAMANLRDPRGVPRLIPLLKTEDAPVVRSVNWALCTLARQDFGTDPKVWYHWWQEHSDHHRIEWLIDALMHPSIEIRRAAGEELKALTKEYFGYYEDLPSAERERAQRAYREWWESKGKAEFA